MCPPSGAVFGGRPSQWGSRRARRGWPPPAGWRPDIRQLQGQIKAMAKADGGAVLAASGWTVNGSAERGRTMLRDYSKLMLRAYNAEADNLVRGLGFEATHIGYELAL